MQDNDEDLLNDALDALELAYGSASNPPPTFDDAVDAAALAPSGLLQDQMELMRRRFVRRLSEGREVGVLLKRRREALGLDVETVAQRAGWKVDEVHQLEGSRLALQEIDPERIAVLLVVLGLVSLGVLEQPLRTLVQSHLEVFEAASAPVDGRSYRNVYSFERRRDLMEGLATVDLEATATAADKYVRAITDMMAELWANRS